MPKNKGKGGKNRRRVKNENEQTKRTATVVTNQACEIKIIDVALLNEFKLKFPTEMHKLYQEVINTIIKPVP